MNLLNLMMMKKEDTCWSIQAVKSKGVQVCYILECEDMKENDHKIYCFNESDQTFIAEGGMGGMG